MSFRDSFNKFKDGLSTFIGHNYWSIPASEMVSEAELNVVREKLKTDYYIILTRRKGQLSTYAIAFAHFFLRGRWGYYGHALMNAENMVSSDADYIFIEATGKGVHYSDFPYVFGNECSSVALLKPKAMSIDEWTLALDRARTELGKPYDTLFDLKNDQALSCVELVRVALQGSPNYATDFANFERMITRSRNLTPQMFYECSDFEVVYEVRH